MDGEKWRHQRKLASYEFSTRVLRDFSTNVFRVNAAKLVSKVSVAGKLIDLQVCLSKTEALKKSKLILLLVRLLPKPYLILN